jgi:hypothetical protein
MLACAPFVSQLLTLLRALASRWSFVGLASGLPARVPACISAGAAAAAASSSGWPLACLNLGRFEHSSCHCFVVAVSRVFALGGRRSACCLRLLVRAEPSGCGPLLACLLLLLLLLSLLLPWR